MPPAHYLDPSPGTGLPAFRSQAGLLSPRPPGRLAMMLGPWAVPVPVATSANASTCRRIEPQAGQGSPDVAALTGSAAEQSRHSTLPAIVDMQEVYVGAARATDG